ncbi:MAG: hypothetical protein IJ282_01755 [Lachnospiraceae bacterium]|nr:hypothetical protein [Lachnospiraceae bacterium]
MQKIYEIVRDALENGKNKFKITVSGNFEGEVRKAVKEGCVIAGYPLDTFSCNSTSHLDGGIVEYWFKVIKEPVEKVVIFYNEKDVRDYYDQCIADGFYGEEAVYYRDTSIDMERIVWDYLLNGAIVGYHIGDEVAPGYYRGTAHVWGRELTSNEARDEILNVYLGKINSHGHSIGGYWEEGLLLFNVIFRKE